MELPPFIESADKHKSFNERQFHGKLMGPIRPGTGERNNLQAQWFINSIAGEGRIGI